MIENEPQLNRIWLIALCDSCDWKIIMNPEVDDVREVTETLEDFAKIHEDKFVDHVITIAPRASEPFKEAPKNLSGLIYGEDR